MIPCLDQCIPCILCIWKLIAAALGLGIAAGYWLYRRRKT